MYPSSGWGSTFVDLDVTFVSLMVANWQRSFLSFSFVRSILTQGFFFSLFSFFTNTRNSAAEVQSPLLIETYPGIASLKFVFLLSCWSAIKGSLTPSLGLLHKCIWVPAPHKGRALEQRSFHVFPCLQWVFIRHSGLKATLMSITRFY